MQEPPALDPPAAVEHRAIASGYSRCSSTRMRADSDSDVSSSSNRHRRLQRRSARHRGPRSPGAPSRRRRGRRAASACCCAARPGNAGSSDGWMFRIRLGKASISGRPTRRMKPARQTRSTCGFSAGASAAIVSSRCVIAARAEASTASIPASRARQARGLRPIRDHDGDRGVERAPRDRIDDRLQIGAAPRNEDAEAGAHRLLAHVAIAGGDTAQDDRTCSTGA